MRRKIIRYIGYLVEQLYPYIGASIVAFFAYKKDINITADTGYVELLNGLVTLDSRIIGFLGAMIPVILSMKNDSKFVRYVFQNDKDSLFSKYMKATIFWGLCNAAISLLLHVKDSFKPKSIEVLFYVWVFVTITFLLATYRSMSHMITLVFRKDESLTDGQRDSVGPGAERRKELRDKYRNSGKE